MPEASDPARTVIMTVDDDPGVSRAVARDLRRRYGESYRIVRAKSGESALEALRELKHELLDGTLLMLSGKIGPRIEVVKDYDRTLPKIPAYPAELNQVWTNLIDNAVSAVGGAGARAP